MACVGGKVRCQCSHSFSFVDGAMCKEISSTVTTFNDGFVDIEIDALLGITGSERTNEKTVNKATMENRSRMLEAYLIVDGNVDMG